MQTLSLYWLLCGLVQMCRIKKYESSNKNTVSKKKKKMISRGVHLCSINAILITDRIQHSMEYSWHYPQRVVGIPWWQRLWVLLHIFAKYFLHRTSSRSLSLGIFHEILQNPVTFTWMEATKDPHLNAPCNAIRQVRCILGILYQVGPNACP